MQIAKEPQTQYTSHRSRLITYARTSDQPTVPSLVASGAGFIQLHSSDGSSSFRCPWCELELKGFHPSHSPLAWHWALASYCPFLQSNGSTNISDVNSSFNTIPILHGGPLSADGTAAVLSAAGVDTEDIVLPASAAAGQGHLTFQERMANTGPTDNAQDLTSPAAVALTYALLCSPRNLMPRTHISSISAILSRQRRHPEQCYEVYRGKSFSDQRWPKEGLISAASLAASGFVYFGVGDAVECVYCHVKISGWTGDDSANQRHVASAPRCPFMRGLSTVTNIPGLVPSVFSYEGSSDSGREISALGIITEIVRYSEFAVQSRREATFLTWPSTNQKLASEMIEHMVFYTGTGDTVCCFSCGTEMSGWTDIEDVWTRHARQAPDCQLLIREKGQDFVTAVIEQHGRFQEPPKEPVVNVVTTRMLRPRMDSLAAQATLRLTSPSYSREAVRNVLIYNLKVWY